MKLKFLGTGAADWTEKDFIDGKEYRRWSSALIDGDLLIDSGPHIFGFAEKNGTPDMFDGVKSILVTHTHQDHFNSKVTEALAKKTGCTLYGDDACLRKLTRQLSPEALAGIKFVPVKSFGEYNIGEYKVYPFHSNHGTTDADEITLHYVVEKDGKRLFYGPDGAWLFYPVWQKLRTMRFDAMILEATVGFVPGDDRIFSHNSIPMLEIMMQTFKKQGCTDENTKFYCSHMAKTLHPDHKTLKAQLEPLGIVPAYDGMEIEI